MIRLEHMTQSQHKQLLSAIIKRLADIKDELAEGSLYLSEIEASGFEIKLHIETLSFLYKYLQDLEFKINALLASEESEVQE